jgi:copper chaperone CopZ
MLLMMLVGVPVYVCATASVPIAAALVLNAGVSPGAALVFLMTGPATNAATITTVWKVMGRRTALIYLGSVAGCALAAGLALDYVFRIQGTSARPGMPWMLPDFVKWGSAAILLGVLGWAVLRPLMQKRLPPAAADRPGPAEKLLIQGMTCTHCVAAVRRGLLECAGVSSAEVDLTTGEALVTGEGLSRDGLRSAVESLGYRVLWPGGERGPG